MLHFPSEVLGTKCDEFSDCIAALAVMEEDRLLPGFEFPVFNFTDWNSTNNSFAQSPPEHPRDEELAKFEIATLALIFVLTVLGNSAVLLALYARRGKLTRMYYFILHLSIADLITAFFNVLPQLGWEVTYRFVGGNFLCKVIKYMQIFGPYLSSYVLVMTAIDRYQAICFPLTYCTWTARRSRIMITVSWCLSLSFCLPQLFIFSYQEVMPGVYDCWGTFVQPWGPKAYVTWYSMSFFIIPLVIVVFTYSCICRAIWVNFNLKLGDGRRFSLKKNRLVKLCDKFRKSRPTSTDFYWESSSERNCITGGSVFSGVQNGDKFSRSSPATPRVTGLQRGSPPNGEESRGPVNPRTHSIKGISRAKIKTVKLTVVVIACYIFCSSPFISAQLWATWDPNAIKSPFWTGATFTILTLLASLNSCVNPWIYLTFNRDLLKLLVQVLCCQGEDKGSGGFDRGTVLRSSSMSDSRCPKTAVTVMTSTKSNGRGRSTWVEITPSPKNRRERHPSNSSKALLDLENGKEEVELKDWDIAEGRKRRSRSNSDK